MGLCDTYRSGAHQVVHRHSTRTGRIKNRLCQPGVDGTCPPTQVELREEFPIHRFQGRQNLADFFAGVACNAAEWVEFVKTAAELEPGRIRQIKRFLEWDRVPTSRRNEAQPKRMIVL